MGVSAFNKQQGFSLLEVLVAFVVMGLVVGTLLQMFGSSVRSVALAGDRSFAIQIAESRLASVGTEIEVEQGEVTGEVDDTDYSWRVAMEPIELVEDTDSFSLSLQPFRIEVFVNWQANGREQSFSLSSIRFGERV